MYQNWWFLSKFGWNLSNFWGWGQSQVAFVSFYKNHITRNFVILIQNRIHEIFIDPTWDNMLIEIFSFSTRLTRHQLFSRLDSLKKSPASKLRLAILIKMKMKRWAKKISFPILFYWNFLVAFYVFPFRISRCFSIFKKLNLKLYFSRFWSAQCLVLVCNETTVICHVDCFYLSEDFIHESQ